MPRGAEDGGHTLAISLGTHLAHFTRIPAWTHRQKCLCPLGIRSPKSTSNVERSPPAQAGFEPGSSQFHALCSYLGKKASEMLSHPEVRRNPGLLIWQSFTDVLSVLGLRYRAPQGKGQTHVQPLDQTGEV